MRRAVARDLDRVVEVWCGLAAHHASLHRAFELRPGVGDEVRELVRRGLGDPDTAILVWEESGDVTGLCVARVRTAPPLLAEAARGEIEDLGVRVGARRRGIGRALAEAALDWIRSRGVGRVEIRVAARNREGQAFWRALGFDPFVDVLERRL